MPDIVDKATRSKMMSSIRGRDTSPELAVRRFLHRKGLRFRLQGKGLPGRPDLVLKKHNAVVFVHGCFWHRHARCKFATTPSTNRRFWANKFLENKKRDRAAAVKLRQAGWRVFIVWECNLTDERLSNLSSQIRDSSE